MIFLFQDQRRGVKRKNSDVERVGLQRLEKLVSENEPPSSTAVGTKFRKYTGPDRIIGCNRPYEKDTIPIALLDEAFGIFRDKCEDLPSETALTLLNELSYTCCSWYSSESARQVAVQEVFTRCSPLKFAPHVIVTNERQCTTDGNLPVHIIPASIRECKDSPGFALIKLFYISLDFCIMQYVTITNTSIAKLAFQVFY